jgi:hypothetical protein
MKVAEEMLLCEVMFSTGYGKYADEATVYEGAVQQDCEKLLLCGSYR